MGTDARRLSEWLGQAWIHDGALVSPKLKASPSRNALWYHYYAGYADTFVADVVARLPTQTRNVLDPWNGSGTTTSVAAAHGIDGQGFDLNPAAVVIAKARILQSDMASSLLPLTRELLAAVEADVAVEDDDLLLRWMTRRAAITVRRLAATINRALIEIDEPADAVRLSTEMSSLAALFYLALFRVVREELSRFAGSNPTWIKQKVAHNETVNFDLRTVRPTLLRAVSDLATAVNGREVRRDGHARIKIAVGDSEALPVADASIEAVITSPPYCTRIDYAVATLPELATLGINAEQLRELRDHLIGTPTRNGSSPSSDARWGAEAMGFLRQVAEHDSHASARYYLPFFSQYFAGMWRSLAELGRVVALGHPIVLVVQDSYYKEIHADIPRVIEEMAEGLGWEQLARRDFQVRTKANINGNARKYRPAALATEAVLAFSR